MTGREGMAGGDAELATPVFDGHVSDLSLDVSQGSHEP
jgi:hypothetical protein